MKTLIKEFGGAIFFYVVIIGMLLAINYRFGELNEVNESNSLAYVEMN